MSDIARPVVMVHSSKTAEALIKASGLTPLELLKPFASQPPDALIKFSTGAERPVQRLSNISLRFTPLSSVKALSQASVNNILTNLVYHKQRLLEKESPADAELKEILMTAPMKIRSVLRNYSIGDLFPILPSYRDCLLECSHFQPGETMDHPIAIFVFLSAQNSKESLDVASKVTDVRYLPEYFRDRIYDVNAVQFCFIVLNDHRGFTGSEDGQGANRICSSVSSMIPGVFTKVIDLGLEPSDEPVPFWARKISFDVDSKIALSSPLDLTKEAAVDSFISSRVSHPLLESDRLEAKKSDLPADQSEVLLTMSDALQIQTCIWQAMTSYAFPKLEQHFLNLVNQVTRIRSGLRNQIKLLFGRGKSLIADSSPKMSRPSGTYEYDSTESMIRRIADIAFQVHSYETALEYYKMVLPDYKTAKTAAFQVASTSEMIVMCHIHMNIADVDEYISDCMNEYIKCDNLVRSSRVALWVSDLFKRINRAEDAARILWSIAEKQKDNLRAAFLFEQAALCFLYTPSRPFTRKYCFFMMLAANVYGEAKHV